MPWLRFLLVLACFLICSMRAEAAPAPIVFDFEDGLQGWTFAGSAQRVQTQVLGGEWAIFGDGLVEGPTLLLIEMNLTDIASISVEQFFVAGNEFGLSLVIDIIEDIPIFASWEVVESGNPSLRVADVSSISGIRPIFIFWPEPVEGPRSPPIVAFIDNITFHPVPEPSTWLLLSLGIAGMVMIRRKVASRA